MTKLIGYNQYPDREEFTRLYETYTQAELAEYYQTFKKRIRKWILYFGLELRPQGGGNNRKYSPSKEDFERWYIAGWSNKDISKETGIPERSVKAWKYRFGILKVNNTPEYKKYSRRVRFLTEKVYAKYYGIINPDNKPRTLCGVPGGYQLDHKKSIRYCYDNGYSIEDCASVENLQIITWEENLKKRPYNKKDILNE